jgi:hypothetical protein
LVWDFRLGNEKQSPHHDITRLPNGNILMIVSDRKTAAEATAAGRRTEGNVMADAILEIKPTGKTTGEVVWEWHTWDHLVQDHDKAKANYGNVSAQPELIDVNFGDGAINRIMAQPGGLDQLRGLGYIGGGQPGAGGQPPGPGGQPVPAVPPPGPGGQPAPGGQGPGGGRGPGGPGADWTHFNAVAYNADLDQIVVSVHAFSEIWIIDHSTTTAEAATHTGGRYGKGGDLLYRWGNPRAYRSGTNADQRLFNQHNAHWIPKGLPGEGHMLVFNNGGRRPDGAYSSVDEIILPVDKDGQYPRKPGAAFGPDRAEWSYTAPNKPEFFAALISGAQRLPNGNTLICSGTNGTVFEVTPEKETVWKFVNPGQGGPGGQAFGGMFGFGPQQVGRVLPAPVQDLLQMSPEQRKQLEELQKELDNKLDTILTADQRKQLKDMREGNLQFVGPAGGGFGGPGARGPGGPGGPMVMGGPGGGGGLFRSLRYGLDFPGLAGKELTPGKKLEELVESR